MTENDLLSNWGRWGEADQIGALNLIDDQARSRAAAEVRDATSVSLARATTPTPLTTGLSPVGSPTPVWWPRSGPPRPALPGSAVAPTTPST